MQGWAGVLRAQQTSAAGPGLRRGPSASSPPPTSAVTGWPVLAPCLVGPSRPTGRPTDRPTAHSPATSASSRSSLSLARDYCPAPHPFPGLPGAEETGGCLVCPRSSCAPRPAPEPPDPALLLGNSQPPSDKGHRKDELPRGTHQSTSGRCPGAHQQEKGKITHCPPHQTQCVTRQAWCPGKLGWEEGPVTGSPRARSGLTPGRSAPPR